MPPLLDNGSSEIEPPQSKSPPRSSSENKKPRYDKDALPYYMVTRNPKDATRIPNPGQIRPQNTLYKSHTKPNHSPNRNHLSGPGFEQRPTSRHSYGRPSSKNGPDTNAWKGGAFHQQARAKEESQQNPSKNKEMPIDFVESQVDDDNEEQRLVVSGHSPAKSTKDPSSPKAAKQNLAERRRKHSSNMLSLTGSKSGGMEIDPDLRPQKMRSKKGVTDNLKSDQDPVKTTFIGNNIANKKASDGRLAIALKEALRWPIHDVKSDTKTLLLQDPGTNTKTRGRLSLYVDSNFKREILDVSTSGYRVFVTDRDLICIRPPSRENDFSMNQWYFNVEHKEDMEELREYFCQFIGRVKIQDVKFDVLEDHKSKDMVRAKDRRPRQISSSYSTHDYNSDDISNTNEMHDRNIERQNRNNTSKKEQMGLAQREPERRRITRLSDGSQNSTVTTYETRNRRTRSSAPKATTARPQPVPCRRPRQTWTEDLRFPFELDQRGATINDTDLTKLDDDEFLNDEIVNFCLHYMLASVKPDLKAKIHLFNTFFFEKFAKPGGEGEKYNYSGVERWTNKIDLFSKDFVIIPINEQLHWYLALICNLPQLAEKCSRRSSDKIEDTSVYDQAETSPGHRRSPRTPGFELTNADSSTTKRSPPPKTQKSDEERITCIIVFDSLENNRKRTMDLLKGYIIKEAKSKKNLTISIRDMRGINAKVPQQQNYSDCGLYLLHYVKEILSRPEILKDIITERQSRDQVGLHQKWNLSAHEMREKLFDELVDLKEKHKEYLKANGKDDMLLKKEKIALSAVPENGEGDESSKDEGNDSLQILTTPPSKTQIPTTPPLLNAKKVESSSPKGTPTTEKSLRASGRPNELSTDIMSLNKSSHEGVDPSIKPGDVQPEQSGVFNDKMDIDEDKTIINTDQGDTLDVEMADESDVDLVVQNEMSSSDQRDGSAQTSILAPTSAKHTKTLSHVEIPTNSLSPQQRQTYLIPNCIEHEQYKKIIHQINEKDRGMPDRRVFPRARHHEALAPDEVDQDMIVTEHDKGVILSNRKSSTHRSKIQSLEIPETPETETIYETDVPSEDEMPVEQIDAANEGYPSSKTHFRDETLTSETKIKHGGATSYGSKPSHNEGYSHPSKTQNERDDWHVVDREKDIYDIPSSPIDQASKNTHQGHQPLGKHTQQHNTSVRDKQKRPASADASLPHPHSKRQRSLPPDQAQERRQERVVVDLIDDDDDSGERDHNVDDGEILNSLKNRPELNEASSAQNTLN